jgi:hypothetical protein
LKTKNAPLRVLPLASFRIRHRVKQNQKKQMREENRSKLLSPSTVQCLLGKIIKRAEKNLTQSTRKGPLTIKPLLRIHFKMNALRWIVLIIFTYLIAGSIIMTIQEGTEPLKNIVIYSIMGFFTFFMGYLGWILARDVLLIISGRNSARNEVDIVEI